MVNLSWGGRVIKELISIGTKVLFDLLPRYWLTMAKSIKSIKPHESGRFWVRPFIFSGRNTNRFFSIIDYCFRATSHVIYVLLRWLPDLSLSAAIA